MRRIFSFLDSEFFKAFAAVLVAASVTIAVWSLVLDNKAKSQRIDTLVTTGAADRRAADEKQLQLLKGQSDLQRRIDKLVDINRLVADYMRIRGLFIPDELLADENKRPETQSEHKARTKNTPPKSHSTKSGGGSGKAPSTGGKDSNSGGGKSSGSSPGKSGSKSHGKNKGGKSSSHKHSGGKK